MYENRSNDLLDYDEGDFNTIIGADISFKGNIRFSKPFLVRGSIDGKINADSDLVVDEGAIVNADINAQRVLVRGTVKGNVNASAMIFVASTGSVTGDINSSQVVLEAGGIFSGRCTMDTANEA